MVKGILISYSGYPYTPSSLMPDNGLANLAGSLMDNGHKVLILDYGTVDTIKRLVPKEFSQKLSLLYNRLTASTAKNRVFDKLVKLYYLLKLKKLSRFIEKFQEKEVHSIARDISEIVRQENPDFVGFKLWNGDGFTGSIEIAERLKKDYPGLPIFAGGPHVDFFREEIFKVTATFDILVYGEAEQTIVDLAEYLEGKNDLENIPNLIYRKNGKIIINPIERIKDLDSLPMPVYDEDVYPAMRGNQKMKIIVFDESRGCPNHCNFCVQPVKSGYLRLKSSERIFKEIKYIIDKYGIRAFRYAGSSTPGKLMGEVAKKIIDDDLAVEYTSFAHVKGASPESFSLLKESGLYALFFGIESGSQDILDKSMNKGLKVDQIRKTIAMAKEAGIFTVGSMIIPAPLDTPKTIKNSLDFILEVRPDSVPVQFAGIYPQSTWAKYPEQFGIELNKETYLQEVMNYKIKLLFPPIFWKPLPYKINGMGHKEFTKETSAFTKVLEEKGILTNLGDDLALMAKFSEMTTKEFRDRIRLWSFTGNYEKTQEMVKTINENISAIGRSFKQSSEELALENTR